MKSKCCLFFLFTIPFFLSSFREMCFVSVRRISYFTVSFAFVICQSSKTLNICLEFINETNCLYDRLHNFVLVFTSVFFNLVSIFFLSFFLFFLNFDFSFKPFFFISIEHPLRHVFFSIFPFAYSLTSLSVCLSVCLFLSVCLSLSIYIYNCEKIVGSTEQYIN